MDSEILLLEELRGKEPIEIGRIMRAVTVEVGREPGAHGLIIANEAVSRVHGQISSLGNYWLYRDLGSTNGSWVNGEAITQEDVRFLRSGNTLQLASSIVRVTELSASGEPVVARAAHLPARSLLVLVGESLIGEYPIPEYGRALVIGGSEGDLEIQGRLASTPILNIERKGMFTTIIPCGSDVQISINGKDISSATPLKDGDQVTVDRYCIIFNEPPSQNAALTIPLTGTGEWSSLARRGQTAGLENTEDSGGSFLNKPAQSSLFGKPLDVQDDGLAVHETVRIDPALIQQKIGRDYHPSMRGSELPPTSLFDSMEQRLVLIIGFALLIALLTLLVLWLFV